MNPSPEAKELLEGTNLIRVYTAIRLYRLGLWILKIADRVCPKGI